MDSSQQGHQSLVGPQLGQAEIQLVPMSLGCKHMQPVNRAGFVWAGMAILQRHI
jgi:hypothetical protein